MNYKILFIVLMINIYLLSMRRTNRLITSNNRTSLMQYSLSQRSNAHKVLSCISTRLYYGLFFYAGTVFAHYQQLRDDIAKFGRELEHRA